jgi:sugar lactone lactonase YvrE
MWKSGASVGSTVAGNGVQGSSLSQLSAPGGIVLDKNGYIYIADTGNYRIVRWAPNSTTGVCIVACTLTAGTNVNQLGWPTAVAFDDKGSLYVADSPNNRIQKFQIRYNQSNIITFS